MQSAEHKLSYEISFLLLNFSYEWKSNGNAALKTNAYRKYT